MSPDSSTELKPVAMEHLEERRRSVTSATGIIERQENLVEDTYWKLDAAVPDLAQLTTKARLATHAEHKMSIRDGLKLYPKAIAWSAVLSLAIVMEGYDTVLLNQFFALPEFRNHYGQLKDGKYELSTGWQSGLANGAVVGSVFGLLLNGILAEMYGYRICMLCFIAAIAAGIFITFFAPSVEVLMVGQILCGIPWGAFQVLTTTYAADVMPVPLRAYLTTCVNLCWITGQLIGSGILRAFVNVSSQWAYRVPFGLQWMWTVPLFICVYFAPDSPWWLTRHGRFDEAKRSLLRLTSKNDVPFDADETVAMMRHTHEIEKAMGGKGDSYLACFKGVNLRRTEICCMTYVIQILSGSPFFLYSTYFMAQNGIPATSAFNMSIGQYGLGLVATFFAWGLLRSYGRRAIYLSGLFAMFSVLLIIGGVGTLPKSNATAWATASLLLFFTFVYDLSIGPVCFSLVSEIPSTRLRVKTVALSRVSYNIVYTAANILMPKALNHRGWDWGAKTGFLWAGSCLLSLTWAYLRLPEPKGLTYCELDILFEHKASARKFQRFQIVLEESGYFSVRTNNEGRSASSDYIE